MTIELHSSAITEEHNRVLPGLARIAPWGVWLRPTLSFFETPGIEVVLRAFEGLQCVVWHVTDGGARSDRLKNHLRAFGNWPALSANILAEWNANYISLSKKFYSGVASVSFDRAKIFAALLARSTSGEDSALSFIPKDSRSTQAWISAVHGLEWLWLLRKNIPSELNAVINADTVLLSYIALTNQIGGVAGLVFDVGGRAGLALFGEQTVLEPAAKQMRQAFVTIEEKIFDQWYRDGLHFPASP